jgi:hypothetical protein
MTEKLQRILLLMTIFHLLIRMKKILLEKSECEKDQNQKQMKKHV